MSFRGAGEAREPGIQKPIERLHLDSGSGAYAPSRNDRNQNSTSNSTTSSGSAFAASTHSCICGIAITALQ